MTALRKQLGLAHGLALYLAAVLGTGILVVPALAWNEGGPASLVAWGLLSLLGLALAWSFAAVSSEFPSAGGVPTMVASALGPSAGALCAWLVFFSLPAGATAGSHIFADHFIVALGISTKWVHWLAWGSLVVIGLANYLGLRVSATVQLVMSGVLVVLLSALVIFALPRVDTSHFTPFAPNGLGGIGQSAVMIFWAFLGWEAISHLAEEFHDPARDMLRAAIICAITVAILYCSVAFVLIGTGAVAVGSSGTTPMTMLARNLFGPIGEILVAALASMICLGTLNAYMAGISRLAYSMALDGLLPKYFAKLDGNTATPRRAILLLLAMYSVTIYVKVALNLPMRIFFLIPNVAFLILYTLGCLSSAKLIRKSPFRRWVALGAAAVCAAMIPFAREALPFSFLVMGISGLALWVQRKNKGRNPTESNSGL